MEHLRRELQRLRSRRAMRQARRSEQSGVSPFTLQVAILISVLLDYDFSAGAAWLVLRRRRGTLLSPEIDDAHAKAILEDEFLKLDVQVLASWADPEDMSLSRSVKRTAAKFAREYRLAAWVRQQNATGAVVPSRVLAEKYNSGSGAPDAYNLTAPVNISSSTSHGRVWAYRWRRLFGARHMRLRWQDPEPLQETRIKVRQNAFSSFPHVST